LKLEEGRPLPSPNQLRGRILIKNKKLKPEQEAEGESSYGNVYLQKHGQLQVLSPAIRASCTCNTVP